MRRNALAITSGRLRAAFSFSGSAAASSGASPMNNNPTYIELAEAILAAITEARTIHAMRTVATRFSRSLRVNASTHLQRALAESG